MENPQKNAVFNKKSAIIKGVIGIGFTILCLAFIGKYAYPVLMGVRLIGVALQKVH